jgi:hypothetical protein
MRAWPGSLTAPNLSGWRLNPEILSGFCCQREGQHYLLINSEIPRSASTDFLLIG